MQRSPRYGNVVEEVTVFLRQRAQEAIALRYPSTQIILDPGFGFGKLQSIIFTCSQSSMRSRIGVPGAGRGIS